MRGRFQLWFGLVMVLYRGGVLSRLSLAMVRRSSLDWECEVCSWNSRGFLLPQDQCSRRRSVIVAGLVFVSRTIRALQRCMDNFLPWGFATHFLGKKIYMSFWSWSMLLWVWHVVISILHTIISVGVINLSICFCYH